MDDHRVKVQNDPTGFVVAFDRPGRTVAQAHFILQFAGVGTKLGVAVSVAENEIVGKNGLFLHMEQFDPLSVLVV